MSKIIKGQVNVDRSVYTEFSKDMGFFSIHSRRLECCIRNQRCKLNGKLTYSHDITEICERFRINGKAVKRDGFEELYVKLYGDGAFAKLLMDFENEVETEYYKTTEYKPINNKY